MTPLLFHWPHWTYAISWLWQNPDSYNFWSSGWGESLLEILKLGILFLLLRPLYRRVMRRFTCHEVGCSNHGKYVIEGGVRCCDIHHPAQDMRPVSERGLVHRLHSSHVLHVAGLHTKSKEESSNSQSSRPPSSAS